MRPIRVAVVGARGYSGIELSRWLLRHPDVDYKACVLSGTNSSESFKLSDYLYLPSSGARKAPASISLADLLACSRDDFDVVFMATPAEASLQGATQFLQKGIHVIDLSGAFRLRYGTKETQKQNYKKWYGFEPNEIALELLNKSIYGLQPWAQLNNQQSNSPLLIANPGCYASSILLALLPLCKAGILTADCSLSINAKSGATGAGRKAQEDLLFVEIQESMRPYRIGQHQHTPEILQGLTEWSGVELNGLHWTTELLPLRRGILSTIYIDISNNKNIDIRDINKDELLEKIAQSYQQAYTHPHSLIESAELNSRRGRFLSDLRHVCESARTHMTYHVDDFKRITLFSMIDNLGKGAATQAIENLNALILNQPHNRGLDSSMMTTTMAMETTTPAAEDFL